VLDHVTQVDSVYSHHWLARLHCIGVTIIFSRLLGDIDTIVCTLHRGICLARRRLRRITNAYSAPTKFISAILLGPDGTCNVAHRPLNGGTL